MADWHNITKAAVMMAVSLAKVMVILIILPAND